MRHAHFLVTIPALILLIANTGTAGEPRIIDKTTGCSVELPLALDGMATVNWSGSCLKGLGDGVGVLRVFDHGTFKGAYFGSLKEGALAAGVLDDGKGYVVYLAGHPADNADRSEFLKAFDLASNAARAFSNRLQAEGKQVSAKHYQKIAEQLGQQMD